MACALVVVVACSGAAGALKEFQAGKYEGVIVRDGQGVYWAIPTVGIDRISGSTIAVKAGTVLGRGEGSGADLEKEIVAPLVDMLRKANVGGFGMSGFEMKGDTYTLTGKVEVAATARDIVASAVVATVEPR